MTKYVKVMFDTILGADRNFKYKINEVNINKNWNCQKLFKLEFDNNNNLINIENIRR